MTEVAAGGVALTIVLIFVGAIIRSWTGSITQITLRLQNIEKDLSTFRENLPKEYVLKTDHEKDLDAIKNEIRSLKKDILRAIEKLEQKIDAR